jgi:hypothetical protein
MAEQRAAQDAARLQTQINVKREERENLRRFPATDHMLPITALAQLTSAARQRAHQIDRDIAALQAPLETAREAHRAAFARRLGIEGMLQRQEAAQKSAARRRAIRRGS